MNNQARIVALKYTHQVLKCAVEYEDPVLHMGMEVLHDFNALENHLEFNTELVAILKKISDAITVLEDPNNEFVGISDVRLDA